jgi:type IV pilus assembly protein PilY1
MTNYNTSALWAAVEHDPYSSNNPSGSRDIRTNNVDVVYCSTSNPNTTDKFTLGTVCKDPVDSTVTPAGEAAGTGVWRYPNPRYSTGSTGGTAFDNRVSRTGTSTNPVPPYFYTISQVMFCINRNATTNATRPTGGNFASKAFYGKGSLTDTTNKCNVRRFNDGTNNYQWPRFGLIPNNNSADTRANNQQQDSTPSNTTDASVDRWAGMSGFRRWNITEKAPAGSNTLPDGYPSRSDSTVYTTRADCSFAPCTYTQEMTNYANWYGYYRTRIMMMKTAAGLAFYDLDDKFRVGFITINPGSPVSSSKYIALNTFNTSQKSSWYSTFYSQTTNNSTPLREALSRVGRHYARVTTGINSGMGFGAGSVNPQGTSDSVIASCQKNFALLTTDGYWNGNGGQKTDGTSMDDQDHTAARPFFDGPSVNSSGAKSSGTLADVAYYYYINDLRPEVLVSGEDVWENNVAPTGTDTATWQHMTTFTLGLGLDGTLDYQSNYDAVPPPAGDYADIVNGTKNWPAPPSGGNEEKALDDLWHAAVNGRGKFFSARNPTVLAASLAEALGKLNSVNGAGAAAATSNLQPVAGDNWAFTAEYQTVDWYGDVKARTIDLVGGIISSVGLWSARDLLDTKCTGSNCVSGATNRTIYTFTSDTANFSAKVKPFKWTNAAGTNYPTDTSLTTTEQAYFNPSQFTTSNLWSGVQSGAATAASVVDYLRGDRSNEDSGASLATDLYRKRTHVLGDIISAQPVYIKAPPFAYSDNGYSAFQTAQAGRRGTLYIAANDGMIHAIETDPDNSPYFQINGITTASIADDTFSPGTNDGGGERWAFIPTRVLQNLYRLGQRNYTHRWFVDGTPIVEDICQATATGSGSLTSPAYACPGSSSWKTILVGGLNGGGRGYYALDVSDPLNPKGLWEFNARDPSVTACAATVAAAVGQSSDCDLGLTYGNPIITKLPLGNTNSGKWVVIVSSGYNNYPTVDGTSTTSGGDGNGYLYILDAFTGTIIEKIKTCSGTPGTSGASPAFSDADPCGFTKINTYHPLKDEKVDNSPVRVYGTTIKGEVWRIDLTQQSAPRAFLVASLKDASGVAQPITTPPEMFLPTGLDTIVYSNPWEAPAAIYIGTGRYLGVPDKTDLQHQSIYAIKDIPGSTTTLTNARTSMQSRTFQTEFTDTASGQQRRNITGGTSNAFTASSGWYVDFPDVNGVATGERVNVDFRIVATTLVILSNISKVNSCVAGGTAWLNFLDVNTGGAIQGLTTPYASVKLAGSLGVGISPIQIGDQIKTIVTTADNQQLTFDTPISGSEFQGQRVQWRELTQ